MRERGRGIRKRRGKERRGRERKGCERRGREGRGEQTRTGTIPGCRRRHMNPPAVSGHKIIGVLHRLCLLSWRERLAMKCSIITAVSVRLRFYTYAPL